MPSQPVEELAPGGVVVPGTGGAPFGAGEVRSGSPEEVLAASLRTAAEGDGARRGIDVESLDLCGRYEGTPTLLGTPMLRGSSKPTHTTATSSGVKPANHRSRSPSLVPVLAAMGPSRPVLRTRAAVPRSTTPARSEVAR